MCAQAVCFMASALHAQLGAPLHGVPEVTTIATYKTNPDQHRIDFDGLFTNQLSDYFNSEHCKPVGASWQAAKLFAEGETKDVLTEKVA